MSSGKEAPGAREGDPHTEDADWEKRKWKEEIRKKGERFKLYTGDRGISVVAEEPTREGSRKIGLTRKMIEDEGMAVLRAAGIHDEDGERSAPYLDIAMTIIGRAFGVYVALHKPGRDEYSGEEWTMESWIWNVTGEHGGNARLPMACLRETLDRFVAEHARANGRTAPR